MCLGREASAIRVSGLLGARRRAPLARSATRFGSSYIGEPASPDRVPAACAFELADPHSAAAQDPSVQGFVADETTSALIPSATVTLVTTGEETASGPDGSFRFDEAPAGPITVRIEAPGYRGALWETEVVEGRPLLFLDVLLSRLEGDAALRRLVTDRESGSPVAGSEVSLPELGVSAETDQSGEAPLSDLPSGRWLVAVSQRDQRDPRSIQPHGRCLRRDSRMDPVLTRDRVGQRIARSEPVGPYRWEPRAMAAPARPGYPGRTHLSPRWTSRGRIPSLGRADRRRPGPAPGHERAPPSPRRPPRRR